MPREFPYRELLKAMIAIPALSREEDARANFLCAWMKDWGWEVQRHGNNLLVGDPMAKGLNILLNSHMDTVPPVEGWDQDPFFPTEDNGRITGLGSNDAGASVVCLAAAYHHRAQSLCGKINLLLLISAEEEVSGMGGIESVLPAIGVLDGVIVGEPTGMQAAVAERGLLVLDGEVQGVAGHAARGEGDNAIYRALDDIRSIRNLKFPEASDWLPPASAQVTMISSGERHNVVPDICRFVVDVRSNDRYGNGRMLELISGATSAHLKARSMRLNPSRLDENHLLMLGVRKAGIQAFGSSTMSDMALIPYPAVKMGPGDSARSHTAGEFVLASELDDGIHQYCEYLDCLAELAANDC